MEKKKLYKATIDLKFQKSRASLKESFTKAIADYIVAEPQNITPNVNQLGSDFFQDLKDFFLKQPDLLYGLSIYASEGVNKNRDAFLREILCRIFKTPRNKFVDYEHDPDGENEGGNNPNEYQIVGHIYDSKLADQTTGSLIPDIDVGIFEDGKWFPKDSSWRDKPLDLVVAWVLYKFQFPELAMLVENMTDIDTDKFGVSMEVLFSDYKFRVGGSLNPEESFDFDGNSTGAWEVRKGNPIADKLQDLWQEGKGRTYNGQSVIRILGGDIFFSGMAITRNRANSRSLNLSIGSYLEKAKEEKKQPNELLKLIESIASRSESFDISTCEIVDGKPSCNCIVNAFAAEIQNITREIDELLLSVSDTEDDDSDKRVDVMIEGVKEANRRLQNFYENSVEENLSGQEMLEFIEDIERIIFDSRRQLSDY